VSKTSRWNGCPESHDRAAQAPFAVRSMYTNLGQIRGVRLPDAARHHDR
jgi:hypothetical protein